MKLKKKHLPPLFDADKKPTWKFALRKFMKVKFKSQRMTQLMKLELKERNTEIV